MKNNLKRLLVFLTALLLMTASAGAASAAGVFGNPDTDRTVLLIAIIVVALIVLAIFLHFVPMGL